MSSGDGWVCSHWPPLHTRFHLVHSGCALRLRISAYLIQTLHDASLRVTFSSRQTCVSRVALVPVALCSAPPRTGPLLYRPISYITYVDCVTASNVADSSRPLTPVCSVFVRFVQWWIQCCGRANAMQHQHTCTVLQEVLSKFQTEFSWCANSKYDRNLQIRGNVSSNRFHCRQD